MSSHIALHNHTKYSLIDGMSSIEEIIEKCKQNNQNAVAITDHGNIDYSVECYKKLSKARIKYIHGCEVYICDDITVKNKNSKYNHLILLCINEESRILLNKIITSSFVDGFYSKPRIDFGMIKNHGDKFVVLSACMAGEVSRALMNNDKKKATDIANKYKSAFGENYYLEFQSHSEPKQQILNRQIVDLANELGIKYVVTTDSHYVNKEDQKYHSMFVQIGQMREVGETYNDCYIQSDEDIFKICKSTTFEENTIAIENTKIIANKCNVKIPLSAPIIPHIEIPKEFESEKEYMKHKCRQGWKTKGIHLKTKEKQQEYIDRFNYEYDAVTRMGFEGYYLLVESYANSVERRGIARGSGGGTLIAYLMNIVDIDPVEYGLYFERFIDVGALDLLDKGVITKNELKIPDFDLDFGREDRDKLIDGIIDKYGEDKVASIGCYQFLKAKSAIKDIAKVLKKQTQDSKYDFDKINTMTKKLDNEMTIEEALNFGILEEYEKEYFELFKYAKKVAGLPKSFSTHACGKIIAMKELDYYMPMSLDKKGILVLRGDMNSTDDVGLVKIDALGLKTIDVIYDTLKLIGKDYEYINPSKLDFSDKKVLSEFAKGNTDGIFQFESDGMQKTLQLMSADSLDDLIASNALYRPGSKDYIPNYARRKSGEEDITYLHEDLEPILKNTYGIIVFQEQLIEIGKLGKLKNPDKLRKATGKKIEELLIEVGSELRENLSTQGWTDSQLDQLWEDMLKFAKYSFNKSHSGAYAIIAYITMYLKVYHPIEFYASLLNSNIGKMDKISMNYNGIKKSNIRISDIKFGLNKDICTVGENEVIYGLSLIKNMNKNCYSILKNAYKINFKKFKNLLDYILYEKDTDNKVIINKTKIETLIKINYFKDFAKPKKILNFINLYNTLTTKKTFSKEKISKELEKYLTHGEYYDKIYIQNKRIKNELITPDMEIVKKSAKTSIVNYHQQVRKLPHCEETDKMYKNVDVDKVLDIIWNDLPDQDFDIITTIQNELECLGYIQIPIPIGTIVFDVKFSGKSKAGNVGAWMISRRNGNASWFTFEEGLKLPPKDSIIILDHTDLKTKEYKGRKSYKILNYNIIKEA